MYMTVLREGKERWERFKWVPGESDQNIQKGVIGTGEESR